MRLHALIPTLCLTLSLAACQGGGPTAPPNDTGDPGELDDLAALPQLPPDIGEEGLPVLPEDAVDEGMRGLTALLTGDVGLNGSGTNPPGYFPSPHSITQPATIGEIALVRLQATPVSPSPGEKIYSDIRGPGGAYSSMYFFANSTFQYKALYVLRNEDLSVRVHNRPSYSGALNPHATDVSYTFETKAIEDSSEPNDDEDSATVTDRTMSKPLGLGATATRSFYDFSASARDKEDWFSTTLTAGAQYNYRLNSYNPRYGTWGYTLKLFNAAGTQVGQSLTIAAGKLVGHLQTPAIPATGTYYVQIVGTPSTRTNNSNVYYSIYSINVCQQAVPTAPVYTPNSGIERCAGSMGRWTTSVSPATLTYSWNFGGGCVPATSTSATPSVTLTGNGSYLGTLTTISACGALLTKQFTYQVGCNWARTVGTPTALNGQPSYAAPTAVLVDASNRLHLTGVFSGTNMRFTNQEPQGTCVLLTPVGTWAMMYLVLNADGSVNKAVKLIEGYARPEDIALTSDGDLRIVGNFTGDSLDFDPGPGTLLMSSPGTTDGFCQAISAEGDLQWAAEWGSSADENARSMQLSANDAINIVGSFADQVDFDPGVGIQLRTSAGSKDAYWLTLLDSGAYSNVVTVGGVGAVADAAEIVQDSSTGYYITGAFSGTCDFDPVGTNRRMGAGGSDAYLVKYNNLGALQWVNPWGATGEDIGSALIMGLAGDPVVAGSFQGTVDFDAGAGTGTRTSSSATHVDCYIATYGNATGNFQWVQAWGSSGKDQVVDLVQVPGSGNLLVYGIYSYTVDFDFGGGTASRTAVGHWDTYLSHLSPIGGFLNVSTWGTGGTEFPTVIAANANRSHPIGYFRDVMDFNPGAGVSTITPRGTQDGFAMRLNPDGTY